MEADMIQIDEKALNQIFDIAKRMWQDEARPEMPRLIIRALRDYMLYQGATPNFQVLV